MQNPNAQNSKLNVRSGGSENAGNRSDVPRSSQTSKSRRRRKSYRSSNFKIYTGETTTLFSLLKGLFIIALLTLGFYQSAKLPFVLPFDKVAEFFEPKTTRATVNTRQSEIPATGKVASTNPPAPAAKLETTNDNPKDAVTTVSESNDIASDEPVTIDLESGDLDSNTAKSETENPVPENTDAKLETVESETDEIRIAKLDIDQSSSSDADISLKTNETSNITDPQPEQTTSPEIPVTQETETPAATSNEASTENAEYTVKAYKAIMFSDLTSADATETPVSHGATVKLLERSGNWAKIKIESSGETGYIHFTQLSEG